MSGNPTKDDPGGQGPSAELVSWKEIAKYLGVSVKTAQNWEKQHHLPVRRQSGIKGRVFANTLELDEWRRQTHVTTIPINHLEPPAHQAIPPATPRIAAPVKSTVQFWKAYALGASAVLLLAAAGEAGRLYLSRRSGPPAAFKVEGNVLSVTDPSGRELWRKAFDYQLAAAQYLPERAAQNRRVWFGNIDDDPGIETLFVLYPEEADKFGTALYCFSKTGEEQWRFKPGRIVNDAKHASSDAYVVANFLAADVLGNGQKQILVTSHHANEHPNQFAILDRQGRLVSEYWHSGHLPLLAVEGPHGANRAEILLGGVNNGFRAATLVVLDSSCVRGASQQPAGDEHQIQRMPQAEEKFRVLFDRSCINRKLAPFNYVFHMVSTAGAIEVHVAERLEASSCEVIYRFDRSMKMTDIEYSTPLRSQHLQMQARRELDHDLTEAEIQSLGTRLTILRGPSQH